MKINLLSDGENLQITSVGSIGDQRLKDFCEMLDHGIMMKSDVHYDGTKQTLDINLLIHVRNSKAKKRLFGKTLWRTAIRPTIKCKLSIKDIAQFVLHDNNPDREEVLIGPLYIKDKDVFIGSFCGWENDYYMEIKIKRINMSLLCD